MTGETPVGVLKDGTVYYAPLGEILRDGDDLVCCHLCGRWLRMIGSTHLRVGHGWTLAQYREAFQLLQGVPTCSRDLSIGLRQRDSSTKANNSKQYAARSSAPTKSNARSQSLTEKSDPPAGYTWRAVAATGDRHLRGNADSPGVGARAARGTAGAILR
jgi:hypothetical protein